MGKWNTARTRVIHSGLLAALAFPTPTPALADPPAKPAVTAKPAPVTIDIAVRIPSDLSPAAQRAFEAQVRRSVADMNAGLQLAEELGDARMGVWNGPNTGENLGKKPILEQTARQSGFNPPSKQFPKGGPGPSPGAIANAQHRLLGPLSIDENIPRGLGGPAAPWNQDVVPQNTNSAVGGAMSEPLNKLPPGTRVSGVRLKIVPAEPAAFRLQPLACITKPPPLQPGGRIPLTVLPNEPAVTTTRPTTVTTPPRSTIPRGGVPTGPVIGLVTTLGAEPAAEWLFPQAAENRRKYEAFKQRMIEDAYQAREVELWSKGTGVPFKSFDELQNYLTKNRGSYIDNKNHTVDFSRDRFGTKLEDIKGFGTDLRWEAAPPKPWYKRAWNYVFD